MIIRILVEGFMVGDGSKLLIAIFLSLFLMGCGRAPSLEEDKTFLPYFHRFALAALEYDRNVSSEPVPIYFADLSPSRIGVCEEHWLQSPKIYIDRRSWSGMQDADREALIFHELGHCILHRDHKDNRIRVTLASGERVIPESLMHTRGVPGALYKTRRENFLNELFNGT